MSLDYLNTKLNDTTATTVCSLGETSDTNFVAIWSKSIKWPELSDTSNTTFDTGLFTLNYQDTYFCNKNNYNNNFYSNRYLDDADFCVLDDLVLPKVNFQEFHTMSTIVGLENLSERILTQSEKNAKRTAICDLRNEELRNTTINEK